MSFSAFCFLSVLTWIQGKCIPVECVSVLFTITNPKHAMLPANELYRLKADVCWNHEFGIHLIATFNLCCMFTSWYVGCQVVAVLFCCGLNFKKGLNLGIEESENILSLNRHTRITKFQPLPLHRIPQESHHLSESIAQKFLEL